MSVILNETPVRTSNNYKINNFKLDEFEWPNNLKNFSNIKLEFDKSKISSNINTSKLEYGNGNQAEQNIRNSSNSNIRLEVKDEKINLKYNFDKENKILVNQLDIVGNKDSQIIIEYNSDIHEKCVHNGIIKVFANENVKLDIIIINILNEKSINIESIETVIEKNAIVNFTIIDLGGNINIQNYYAKCVGNNSKNDLKTIYYGKNNDKKDFNYIIHIYGEKSVANIDVQGAISDNCKKSFKGTIDFKKGCKKSKGNENEFCLLLSEKAKSIALPMLLCTEKDVEGNHSTASGKIDVNLIFYLMSRGISYEESVKLLIKSKFNKIIDRAVDKNIKDKIEQEIDRL